MEISKPKKRYSDIARALMLQEQFYDLCRKAEGLCNIVPLKGISLLMTLYGENLDRAVGDIDILIFPQEKLSELIERMKESGYSPQFKYLQSDSAKNVKRKVALISPDTHLYSDIDIHTAFVSKKFYSQYCGTFNHDALSRCKKEGNNIYYMDAADQWLYLAQHACFHIFSEPKWLRDLMLLWQQFTDDDKLILKKRITQYNFNRVVTATLTFLRIQYPKIQFELSSELEDINDRRFNHFLSCISKSAKFRHRTAVKYFYEFMFIDKHVNRKSAYRHLIFPSLSLMMTIYRSNKKLLLTLLYPFHIIGVSLTLLHFMHITAPQKSK